MLYSIVCIYTCVISLIVLIFIFFKRRSKILESKGRHIFISGCDTGIGNKLALYFDRLGCTVFAGCLRPAEATEYFPKSIHVVPLDVTDEESIQNAVGSIKRTLRENGAEMWCLINNAGVCVVGEFDWLTKDQCFNQVRVNLLGTIRLTKACLPLLRKSNGRIVTITSVNGFIAYPGLAIYSATKFALEGFFDSLRIELKKHNINVVIVQPGDLARATNIMANHERNAQLMWSQMPDEDKELYENYFKAYHKSTLSNYGLTSPKKIENSDLLKDVHDAVLSQTPKVRYLSAPLLFKIFYRLLAVLPIPMKDYFFVKLVKRMACSDINDYN